MRLQQEPHSCCSVAYAEGPASLGLVAGGGGLGLAEHDVLTTIARIMRNNGQRTARAKSLEKNAGHDVTGHESMTAPKP